MSRGLIGCGMAIEICVVAVAKQNISDVKMLTHRAIGLPAPDESVALILSLFAAQVERKAGRSATKWKR